MRTLVTVIVLLLAPVRALAIWDKFSPFEPGKAPARFPLTVLAPVRDAGGAEGRQVLAFSVPGATTRVLSIAWAEEGNHVSIHGADTARVFTAAIEGNPLCEAQAVVADLNGDGQPDYVVVTHTGGNGLAGQITFVTFLLSSAKGYMATPVVSYDAAPSDLVDLDGDGRPEFVHCMSVWGDTGKDGRSHNYWVYNLLGFSGTEIVSANRANAAFPKWILYTYAANHKDSPQLTADQRRRQWAQAWSPSGGYFESVRFPDAETFAREQGRTLR